jgi:hypothetical protein
VSAHLTRTQRLTLAHKRLQELDRIVEAYELAECRILQLLDKLGATEAMRARLDHCQAELAKARTAQDNAWLTWQELV